MEKCLFSMPKVELHAHLNGSIRNITLYELARDFKDKNVLNFKKAEHLIFKWDRRLPEVHELFDIISILTTDHGNVTRITKEAVEDFASDNVVYLELRITPKYADGGMSKRSYIEAVVEGIRAVSSVDVAFEPGRKLSNPSRSGTKYSGNTRKKIFVRLILSIERRETTAMAMETVMLAIEMRRFGIVGISLHGNPFTGQWDTYLPALEFARACGLYVTLHHRGDVPKSKEIHDMLDFVPHRIGHACYFDEEHRRKLKSSNIPVEICLTSNIETRSVSSIYRHHFVDLYEAKHPIALCTDQPGVFDTSLTEEYMIAASTFGLGRKEMLELSKNAVEFIFADNVVKEELRKYFNSAAEKRVQ